MRPVLLTKTLAAASVNAIAQSQVARRRRERHSQRRDGVGRPGDARHAAPGADHQRRQ